MSIRIFIHTEKIETAQQLLQFPIRLPQDCGKVIGIGFSVLEKHSGDGLGHKQWGQLRLERRGHILYDDFIVEKMQRAQIDQVFVPEIANLAYITGARVLPMVVDIDGKATLLEATIQANDTVPFTISIIFYYRPQP